jgi:hypothetical protein
MSWSDSRLKSGGTSLAGSGHFQFRDHLLKDAGSFGSSAEHDQARHEQLGEEFNVG